jgi:DNA-binding transcriptional MerR regulator
MLRKLVREKNCAEALSVSVRTLRYWRRRKIIPYLKVGALVFYDLDEVLRALRAYKREVAST